MPRVVDHDIEATAGRNDLRDASLDRDIAEFDRAEIDPVFFGICGDRFDLKALRPVVARIPANTV